MAPSHTYYGFKTFASDDVEWNVFFDKVSGKPKFAIAEGANGQKVVIKEYKYRSSFEKEEMMPKECFEQRKIERVEGPIMPLADFGFVY